MGYNPQELVENTSKKLPKYHGYMHVFGYT